LPSWHKTNRAVTKGSTCPCNLTPKPQLTDQTLKAIHKMKTIKRSLMMLSPPYWLRVRCKVLITL
jgi:hypothetical protein